MSDDVKYNLITRAMHNNNYPYGDLSYEWEGDWLHVSGMSTIAAAPINAFISAGSLKADTAYTLSVEFLGGSVPDGLVRSSMVGGACRFEINHTPGASQCATSTVGSGNDTFLLYGPRVALGESVDFRTRFMLVEGTTPAAWAPAEGESLPGGGCSDEC